LNTSFWSIFYLLSLCYVALKKLYNYMVTEVVCLWMNSIHEERLKCIWPMKLLVTKGGTICKIGITCMSHTISNERFEGDIPGKIYTSYTNRSKQFIVKSGECVIFIP
jgi:hypothetical protein